jgi:hypothetical protein
MANQFVIATGSVTLVAATPKTCIEIPTSATSPIVVYALEVMSAATAAGTLIVEWGTFTTTGTGTTVTPQKWGADQSIAALVGTVKIADSVEPAGFAVGTLSNLVIPLPGMYSVIYPFGREMYQPISVNRAIRVNSSLASPVRINLYIEH